MEKFQTRCFRLHKLLESPKNVTFVTLILCLNSSLVINGNKL